MTKRPMIAIVEDDESMREATMSLMRSAGFEPEAFTCADEFLNSDFLQRTDFLIADVQMPGMSGIELHGRLRQSGTAIPTVLVTAYPDEKARARAIASGVISYLTKPFDMHDLLGCIEQALGPIKTRSDCP